MPKMLEWPREMDSAFNLGFSIGAVLGGAGGFVLGFVAAILI